MPISNATIKGAANPANVVNPSSYISGVVKTMRNAITQISGSIKEITISSNSGSSEIQEMDEKLLNDIGMSGSNRISAHSSDLSNHQHQRMFWY